ncbi:hypothetical protein [Kibdelosporangium phytohabitans]|uniref:hypothetical protein n=1 Tax=Kibdelosporangium phytohabitans TaxID=860235 RepID=UPI0012FB66C5|nr:hypothetical protein [Kibdelosporangium phytohabitans]MBE1470634.1 hypothetical protein [Kibdelosporangium phytohabitans]
MRNRIVVVLTVVVTLFAGITSAANAGPRAAVLGHVCEGPVGSTMKFSIVANGSIPAGSTWTVATTKIYPPYQFNATSDSGLLQSTRLSDKSIQFTASATLANGTVVKITPSNFFVASTGSTNVSISGYGGSHSVTYSATQDPC